MDRIGSQSSLIQFDEPFVWSPDGDYLAYGRIVNDIPVGLFVTDMELGLETQLVEGSASDYAWSVDSSQIAFFLVGNSVFPANPLEDGLYVVNRGNTELTLVERRFVEEDLIVEVRNPHWSPSVPDILAYAAYTSVIAGVNVTTTTALRVVRFPALELQFELPRSVFDFSWAPNQLALVYVDQPPDMGDGNIYLSKLDGSDPLQINDQSGYVSVPMWSPGGNSLLYAFSATDSDDMHIYTVQADGTGQSKLTTTGSRNPKPAWSPDGNCIAFIDSQAESLVIMNSDGSAYTRVTTGFNPRWFQWRPRK